MNSLFVEQVQYLMQLQQIKEKNKRIADIKYYWLCDRKITLKYLTSKEEWLLYGLLNRVSQVDKVNVLNNLWNLVDTKTNIPQTAINLLNQLETENYLRQVAFSRTNSFRSSLRKFTLMFRNRIVPEVAAIKPKRSVSFNDRPTVYSISK